MEGCNVKLGRRRFSPVTAFVSRPIPLEMPKFICRFVFHFSGQTSLGELLQFNEKDRAYHDQNY